MANEQSGSCTAYTVMRPGVGQLRVKIIEILENGSGAARTMEPEQTRASLLSRVRDPSNDAAWRQFDALYRELILRYCRSRGIQAADAEDIRQAVMISLSSALRSFEYQPARGKFRHYLCRAVRNAIFEHQARPKGRHQSLGSTVLSTQPAEDDGQLDELWEREWTDHHYRLAMKSIRASFDAKSVEVFDRLLGGDGVETVAGEYDMTTQAVHKVKQRIRNRMRELIEKQIQEEDESV